MLDRPDPSLPLLESIATTPVFAVIVAHVFTADERLTGGKLAGVLLGVAGVAAIRGSVIGAGKEEIGVEQSGKTANLHPGVFTSAQYFFVIVS